MSSVVTNGRAYITDSGPEPPIDSSFRCFNREKNGMAYVARPSPSLSESVSRRVEILRREIRASVRGWRLMSMVEPP